MIGAKRIVIEFLGTDYMIADIFTKTLQGVKLREMRSQLMGN